MIFPDILWSKQFRHTEAILDNNRIKYTFVRSYRPNSTPFVRFLFSSRLSRERLSPLGFFIPSHRNAISNLLLLFFCCLSIEQISFFCFKLVLTSLYLFRLRSHTPIVSLCFRLVRVMLPIETEPRLHRNNVTNRVSLPQLWRAERTPLKVSYIFIYLGSDTLYMTLAIE